MLQALQRLLAEEFELKATAEEVSEGEQLVESASAFESAVLAHTGVGALDQDLLSRFNYRLATNTA